MFRIRAASGSPTMVSAVGTNRSSTAATSSAASVFSSGSIFGFLISFIHFKVFDCP